MADKLITEDADMGSALPDGQSADTQTPDKPLRAETPPATLVPDPNMESGAALDALLESSAKAAADKLEAEKAAAASSGDKPAGDASTGDKPAGDAPTGDKPADDATAGDAPAADKPVGDKPVGDKPAGDAPAPGKDEFDAIQLPPHARPKSGEAFENLKRVARERVSELAAKTQQLEAEVKKLTEAASNAVTPEEKAELEELRKFKRFSDIEAAPEFKEFDGTLNKTTEQIYTKLAEAGVAADQIAKIKELGGVESVDWDALLPNIPAIHRRYLEAKLLELTSIREKKQEAITAAKAEADKFFETRKQRETTDASKVTAAIKAHAEQAASKIEWLNPRKAPDGATPEQRAAIDKHNKAVQELRTRLDGMLKASTPEDRAELAVGTVAAYAFKAQLDSANVELTNLRKQLQATTGELDKIKKASGAGRKASSAPTVAPPVPTNIHTRAEDALDRLRQEQLAASA